MEVLHPRCAGIDVHKDVVVAAVRCVSEPVHREVRSFGTTTSELLALSEWLGSHQCTHVVMEATGVYWKPVWHLLEEDFELVECSSCLIASACGLTSMLDEALAAFLEVLNGYTLADVLARRPDFSRFLHQKAIS